MRYVSHCKHETTKFHIDSLARLKHLLIARILMFPLAGPVSGDGRATVDQWKWGWRAADQVGLSNDASSYLVTYETLTCVVQHC